MPRERGSCLSVVRRSRKGQALGLGAVRSALTSLDHEALDVSVEVHVVIVAASAESQKVFAGARRLWHHGGVRRDVVGRNGGLGVRGMGARVGMVGGPALLRPCWGMVPKADAAFRSSRHMALEEGLLVSQRGL